MLKSARSGDDSHTSSTQTGLLLSNWNETSVAHRRERCDTAANAALRERFIEHRAILSERTCTAANLRQALDSGPSSRR